MEPDTVGRQFEPYRWRPCDVTWDAVPEQSCGNKAAANLRLYGCGRGCGGATRSREDTADPSQNPAETGAIRRREDTADPSRNPAEIGAIWRREDTADPSRNPAEIGAIRRREDTAIRVSIRLR